MSGQLVSTLRGKIPQRAIRHLGELPFVMNYTLDAVDMGAGDTGTFILPTNRRGKVVAIEISDVTEATTADSSGAIIQVGDGSDVDAYCVTGELPVIAIGGHYALYDVDATITAGVTEIIEPGSTVTVTAVAPTGGTPAGIGDIVLSVLLFD